MQSESHQPPKPPESVSAFQLGILLLSLLVLALLAVDLFVHLPPQISRIVRWVDGFVCLVFLLDFVIRFKRAPDKLRFMRWGWIDLLASLPNLDFLRWGRLVRVFQLIRLLRAIRSAHRIADILFLRKRTAGFGSAFLTTFLLIGFSSGAILMFENGPDANIRTAEDAVWWSVTTITTVGYGDKYPTTPEGRILAIVLMLSGAGLFGTLSGLVASVFLGKGDEDRELAEIKVQLTRLEAKLDALPLGRSGPDHPSGAA